MSHSYADYCPISVGVDILGDRWTPLVIRELMVGCTGFNEIHRGLPKMSRSLLSQRLRTLERQGVVERRADRQAVRYRLTDAGQALTPIVWAMGEWAAEWKFGDPADEDLDGLSVIWRMHQRALRPKLPAQRTVVHVVLTGGGGAQGWLDFDKGEVSVCKTDPGYDVDLAMRADTRAMHRWLVGLVPFRELVTSGEAMLIGPSRLARAFPGWFDTGYFAEGLRRGERRRAREAGLAS